ncbi:Uncharacterised protein [Yersinia intermedia]|nr:molecular chaperone GrpE [Yersinia sp. FDAARGOS_228]AVL37908.1 molecular chaperone GrpE [Yersinia intermedia]CRY80241.1 Uncharacterised protein [Yersinia intermedia]VDZ51999.1 Uncharacterised protein [Yersinia intermedia]
MGGKCSRVPWVTDNTNTIESFIIHCRDFPYWGRLLPHIMTGSLESPVLIPIISQVARLMLKRGDIHE